MTPDQAAAKAREFLINEGIACATMRNGESCGFKSRCDCRRWEAGLSGLLAEVAGEARATDWRPMEDAPKNRPIMLWEAGADCPVFATWDNDPWGGVGFWRHVERQLLDVEPEIAMPILWAEAPSMPKLPALGGCAGP